jgi:hypothetical protein
LIEFAPPRQLNRYAANPMMNKSMPDQDVRGIGRVVVNFQLLEFTVVRIIWILADTNQEIGERITGCVHFRSLCELLQSLFLYRVKEPSLVKRFQSLMKRIEEAAEGRNKVVHSWWFIDVESGVSSRLKPKKKSSPSALRSFYDSTDIDYDDLSRSILAVTNELTNFINELHAAKLIPRKLGISLDSLRGDAA